jgi:hypothetical protein
MTDYPCVHEHVIKNGLKLLDTEKPYTAHLRREMHESLSRRQLHITHVALDSDNVMPHFFQSPGNMRTNESAVSCNGDLHALPNPGEFA